MDMPMENQLGLSPAEAKDYKKFESAEEVGYYFRKLLRIAGQSLENSTGATSETLKSFLESIQKNNRASLRDFLKRSSLSTSPDSAYPEFKRRYELLLVNQVLFLIDEEFLVKNDRNVNNPYAPPPHAERIKIMMSTILWAHQIFPGEEWKVEFVSFPYTSLRVYLNWLGQTGQRNFLMGGQLSDQDEHILDKIWRWFEIHDQRSIQLAFAMARNGMVRDVLQERGVLGRIIEELIELDDLPPPIGNKPCTGGIGEKRPALQEL